MQNTVGRVLASAKDRLHGILAAHRDELWVYVLYVFRLRKTTRSPGTNPASMPTRGTIPAHSHPTELSSIWPSAVRQSKKLTLVDSTLISSSPKPRISVGAYFTSCKESYEPGDCMCKPWWSTSELLRLVLMRLGHGMNISIDVNGFGKSADLQFSMNLDLLRLEIICRTRRHFF